jgi:branched-chain amino acid transport system permease protein
MGWLEDLGIWAPIATVAGIYAVFALGLQLQVGQAGLRNFGHVGFWLIGAYTMALLDARGVPIGWSITLAVVAAMVAAGLVAVPTLRLRGDFLAIVTIAGSEIMRIMANNASFTGGPGGMSDTTFRSDVTRPILGWARDNDLDIDRALPLLVIVWTAVLVLGVALWLLSRTPWGRVLRAVREDEHAARALGKNAFLYKVQAMMIGGGCAGLAGVFYVANQVQFSPTAFEPIVTFSGFMIIIAGGLGSFRGAVLGALLLQTLLESTRYMVDVPSLGNDQEAALRYVVVGLVLMLVVAFRPQGIFGKREEMVLGD